MCLLAGATAQLLATLPQWSQFQSIGSPAPALAENTMSRLRIILYAGISLAWPEVVVQGQAADSGSTVRVRSSLLTPTTQTGTLIELRQNQIRFAPERTVSTQTVELDGTTFVWIREPEARPGRYLASGVVLGMSTSWLLMPRADRYTAKTSVPVVLAGGIAGLLVMRQAVSLNGWRIVPVPGNRVRVTRPSFPDEVGTLVSMTRDSLYLRRSGSSVISPLPRGPMQQLEVSDGYHTKATSFAVQGVRLGGLVSFFAGGALSRSSNRSELRLVSLLPLVGAAIGAAVGHSIQTEAWHRSSPASVSLSVMPAR